MGPMNHDGTTGYLSATAHLADGRTYLQATIDTIVSIVTAEPRGEAPIVPT